MHPFWLPAVPAALAALILVPQSVLRMDLQEHCAGLRLFLDDASCSYTIELSALPRALQATQNWRLTPMTSCVQALMRMRRR